MMDSIDTQLYFVKVFRPRTSPEAIDLVSKLLEYTPGVRLSAVEAMVHPFFDELRVEGQRMPNGKDFPPLFEFTREGECEDCVGMRRTDDVEQSSLYDRISSGSWFHHNVSGNWPRGQSCWTRLCPYLLTS